MRVAITSQNFRTVTGHAGKTRRFLVYEIGSDGRIEELERLDLPKESSIHEHDPGKPHPLDDVDVLITAGCGEGFVNKMARRAVRVVRTEETDPLSALRAEFGS